jgi:tetratricopeptide (TPR) repeat protein
MLRLTKRFETPDGLSWFDERLTLVVGHDDFGSLDAAAATMGKQGFTLALTKRVVLGAATVPLWYLRRHGAPDESDWVAIVLHGGRAVVMDLRSTPNDGQAVHDLVALIVAVDLTQDPRSRAWSLFLQQQIDEARRSFVALVSANDNDANARYGLGLTELAGGDTARASRDLQAAARQLGLAEDVRPALGRAAWEQGDIDRAAAYWVQALRDNPDLETELRPALEAASGARPGESGGTAFKLVVITLDFLKAINGGDQLHLVDLENTYRETFDHAVELCLSGTCRIIGTLLAAYDVERGMDIVRTGVTERGPDEIYHGEQMIFDGLRGFSDRIAAAEK